MLGISLIAKSAAIKGQAYSSRHTSDGRVRHSIVSLLATMKSLSPVSRCRPSRTGLSAPALLSDGELPKSFEQFPCVAKQSTRVCAPLESCTRIGPMLKRIFVAPRRA